MWKYLNMWKKDKNKKTKREIKEITYEEIRNDYIIIDVRSRKEYKEGHINGAINIPLSNIKDEINKFEKTEKILLYCQSGLRSKKGAKMLESLGYKEIYNLTGGIENI